MTHYICTGGCRAESDKPGVCGTVKCPKHGTPFTECDCTDGKHYGSFDQDQKDDTTSG